MDKVNAVHAKLNWKIAVVAIKAAEGYREVAQSELKRLLEVSGTEASAVEVLRTNQMQKYQCSSKRSALLAWAQAHLADYPTIAVTNFASDWHDGRAFCALIHHFQPIMFRCTAFLPSDDAHVPHEGVEVLQRPRENFVHRLQRETSSPILTREIAQQPTLRRILEVTLPHRGRAVGSYRKLVLRVSNEYLRFNEKSMIDEKPRNSECTMSGTRDPEKADRLPKVTVSNNYVFTHF
ncbi:hypothetical protein KIN20_022359 [Parelaphostrongylus tenuis]|uniref:Calponin-homology (CH) domain-containing protein n=1 Tax=Parelaphostrongylus tenuis TaxID=148309 RepID=A0AAD5N8W9_PARTN|nr:hypothetical protein KIN20_022359 [Parelaphostrongylus tenuis]